MRSIEVSIPASVPASFGSLLSCSSAFLKNSSVQKERVETELVVDYLAATSWGLVGRRTSFALRTLRHASRLAASSSVGK